MENKETKEFDFAALIRGDFNIGEADIRSYSPLTLAYIGDAVFDLVIRTMLVEKGNSLVNKLHKEASSLVKAGAQCVMVRLIEQELSEEEQSVYKRGRNAKSFTMAKNATVKEYRMATGFEALLGFLYLSGSTERYMYIVKHSVDLYKKYLSENPESKK
jgi:ribonuclease-3 family protein